MSNRMSNNSFGIDVDISKPKSKKGKGKKSEPKVEAPERSDDATEADAED